ncbi:MAG TPA: hypothetical protein VK742_08315 [Candidatus Sulfotelmatobacter sp.]|nr:hypothetical protein [Candidatus Sulfotelmatobacter sp.]
MNPTLKTVGKGLLIAFLAIIIWPFVRPFAQKVPVVGKYVQ